MEVWALAGVALASLATAAGAVAFAWRMDGRRDESERRARRAVADLADEREVRAELAMANAVLVEDLDELERRHEEFRARAARQLEAAIDQNERRRADLRADPTPGDSELDRELRLLQAQLARGRDGAGSSDRETPPAGVP